MRKWIRLCLAVVCVVFLCTLSVLAISRESNALMGIQRSRGTVAESDEKAEGYLQIDEVRAPYDAESNIWYVPQDPETESWVGELSWSDGSKLTVLDDPLLSDKAAALAQGTEFTLEIGGQKTAGVVFTGMPAVTMTAQTSDPTPDERYPVLYGGDFSFFDPTGQSGSSGDELNATQYAIVGASATWHARGATSMSFPKTSWRLELHDEDGENLGIPLLDLREDDDWILMSMYNDDSKIRDKLSIDLWNAIASDNDYDPLGTRMRYVEVFVNDEYMGLYGLLEPLDQKTEGIELESELDFMYKTTDWYCPSNAEMMNIRSQESRSFRLEWPKEYGNGSQWQPLRDYISIYYNDADSTNELIQLAHANVPNFIDYGLFINATTAIDDTFKNAYIIARQEKVGAMKMYVFTKVPWDLNYTWGEAWTDRNSLYTFFNPAQQTANYLPGDISTIMWRNYDEIAPQIEERWAGLRDTVLSQDAVFSNMDALRAYLDSTGAFTRDSARWPESGNDPDLTEMKDFFVDRYEYLDSIYGY